MAVMIHLAIALPWAAFLLFLSPQFCTGELRGAGMSMVRFEATLPACRPTRLFMAAVAFLHYSVGTARRVADCPAIAWFREDRSARLRQDRCLGAYVFDIYTIIFLACGVHFPPLRSVLGQRTAESGRPMILFSARAPSGRPGPRDKVVALPGRRARRRAETSEPAERSIAGGHREPAPHGDRSRRHRARDNSFDAKHS